jgi:hypothetical protein
MISLLRMRRFCPWLLGLFFIAQVACIMPLVGAHLQHLFAGQQDMAEDLAASGPATRAHHHAHHTHVGHQDGRHDHDTNDPNDQCCTLHHHLAGIAPHAIKAKADSVLIASVAPFRSRFLVGADPGRQERPPKFPLSI